MATTQIRGDTQLQNGTLTNDSLTSRTTDLTLATVSNGDVKLSPNGTGVIDAVTHKIKNVVDPTLAQDAATKAYVDSLVNGLAWKQPSLAATVGTLNALYAGGYTATATTITENVVGNGDFTPIDAVTLANGNRVLIKDETSGTFTIDDVTGSPTFLVSDTSALDVGTIITQTSFTTTIISIVANVSITVASGTGFTAASANYDNKQFNGIYVVTEVGDGATTPWVLTRANDMNSWSEVPAAATFVEEGTVNADKAYVCTSDPGGTLGTTDVTFVLFASTSGLFIFTDTNSINFTTIGTTVTADVIPDTVTANTLAVTITSSGVGVKYDGNSFSESSETLTLASGVAGDGISLTTGVLAVELSSVAGLEFGSGGDAGKLQIKTDGTTANTIGVTHVANGAGILYSSTNFSGTTTLALKSGGVLYANTTLVTRENLSSQIGDGSPTVFTIANSFVSGSEHVYLNGLLQNSDSGDYTVTGAAEITFGVAPLASSVLLITYWKS